VFWLALLGCVVLLGFMAFLGMLFIWMERKVAGRMQDRLGPTRTGWKFGWAQSPADGLKLLMKEDLIPDEADQPLFRLAPYLVFVGAFLPFMVLPFADGWVSLNLNIGVIFVSAVLGLEVFGVILAGYASGSKWSLYGGMRQAAQVVSNEVPMALCLVVPVMAAGTMNMVEIVHAQEGGFWNWFMFRDPFTFGAFFLFFLPSLAACKRAPFDLAEAESELVAGFLTEYSGMRWAFFFFAEYGAMFVVAGVAVSLWMGGWWNFGIPVGPTQPVLQAAVFVTKSILLVFVMIWIRWTLPRLRIDQVMHTCLKYFIPIACFMLLGAAIWPIVFPNGVF